ncbi:hypothetical protein UF75_3455 [Desulfosporosinus sp. I2]|uniref:CARDB domain-containing protein n=1 Tax=Desulfosporosinus sp. I2 TaxID=1617025 RepID=UPI0005EEF947|nr:CARDB domain-containing protein [Desulfosporosinus sp. I2]KJR46168.1 hypothetical protein UF75_3455 [Desulfosporosinus sp. I2]
MKRKALFILPFMFLCFMLLSVNAYAMTDSDIEITVTAPVDSLTSESGVVAVEQFPAQVKIDTTAKVGTIADIQATYKGKTQAITPGYILTTEDKADCGPYTITAKTDKGAVLTITVNVVFQVKATYDIRYRTTAINLKEIYEGDKLIKSFPTPQRVRLENANTVAEDEKERIAGLIGRSDGKTYTLKGSLIVEIHNFATGKIYGTYDTDEDFVPLTTGYGWTPKALIAFETMRDTAISYQAPVKLNIDATWCSENKQEIYGKLSAQDKGVPEYLYPYQTTAVTFSKEDSPLSRNFIYSGLEWDYTPESAAYVDGESKTQTSLTQPINYKIPAAGFYFKFKKQDANDLSVVINAPAAVYRGDSYSFTVTFTNSGTQPAYDVPLKGKVDDTLMEEIPARQDFAANESKTYTIQRKAGTSAAVIHLWANIGVPEGFIDSNLANNTATADIRVVEKAVPEPLKTPEPKDNPEQPDNPEPSDNPVPQEDIPPVSPKLCYLSASILAPPTVYEHENYSFTVSFTNQSDTELTNAVLQGTNNEAALTQIPKTCGFKPQETKSFTITGTAGSKGEVYNLWANIGAPDGFRDENPVNNTAVSKITVVAKPSVDPTDPGNPPDDPHNPPGNPDNPPNNPDNPDNPTNPDVPAKMLCDVWTNLSCPPLVYEQEEYSFTVYFANSTDKALSGVSLNASINGSTVSTVPSQADFKVYEKKAFLVKGKAGEKGATIHLSAQITPPAEYRDTNPGNNLVTAEIMVLERPYDLDVQRITPDRYKEQQTVITTIKVSNKGSQDFTPGKQVIVLLEIPELALSKRVDAVVMEQDTWNVVAVKWDTPSVQADKSITLIATINPDRTLNNESSTTNNTYTQRAVIKNVTYDEPEESRTIPAPPQRSDQPKVSWWEQRYESGQFVWRQFYAELKVTATLDYDTKAKGYLKSGYGFSISVTTTVDTNYDRPELITAPQTAEVYLPQYRYETAISLMANGTNHFTFRENPSSPFKYKKQYVPVWFPDNRDYIVQLLVTDVHTPGGTLSKWITGGELKLFVVDSMYSDDVTTGS